MYREANTQHTVDPDHLFLELTSGHSIVLFHLEVVSSGNSTHRHGGKKTETLPESCLPPCDGRWSHQSSASGSFGVSNN